MSHPVFEYTRGTCKLVQWAETIKRERVMMIVENTQLDKYLIVQYKSNDEISFPAWGIEIWDDEIQTITKELQEEAGLTLDTDDDITKVEDRFFEVRFYSPKRKKNYYNKTHLYHIKTQSEINYKNLSEEEKSIQMPYRWSLEDIRKRITTRWKNTNYETMDYIVSKLEEVWCHSVLDMESRKCMEYRL
jgi:8-oxo-dGTP pyrophosphatase MutT (NUDIX family)